MATQKGKPPPRPGQPGAVGKSYGTGEPRQPTKAERQRSGIASGISSVFERMEQSKEDAGSTGRISRQTGKRLPPKSLGSGLGALIPTGDDFGVYWVQPVDQYYQGPSKSSCVVAHVFIPVVARDELDDSMTTMHKNKSSQTFEESIDEGMSVLSQQFAKVRNADTTKMGGDYNVLGYTYVMFRNRAGATSGVYKYGPMPLYVYRNYREYSSKGKGINQILEPFGYTKDSWPV